MASAIMRRSALTALLAAAATVLSPLAGTAFAAAPALTAPTTVTPADGSTAHANRPPIGFGYNTTLNQSTSTIAVVDTSANNAAIGCAPGFSSDGQSIGCTLQSDLVDGHKYAVAVHAENADGTSKRDDGATWTVDIPSLVSTTPAEGSTVASPKSVSATYDERLDTSHATVTVVNGAGHAVPGSVSVTNAIPTNDPTAGVRGTVTFTASSFSGLGASTYTVLFHVDGVTAGTTPNSYNDNPNAFANTVLHFTVDNTPPPAAPYNVAAPPDIVPSDPNHVEINQANVKTVDFSGMGPAGSNVAVAIYDETADSNPLSPSVEGFGPNDSIGATVIPSTCSGSDHEVVNGVTMCRFTVSVDASGSPDTNPPAQTLQWYAFTFTGAAQLPAGPDPTNDPVIGKDTTGPASAPSGVTAYCTCQNPSDSNNYVTANATEADPQATSFRVTVADAEGHSVTSDTGAPPTLNNATVDLGAPDALDDGTLAVTVYALDKYSNAGTGVAATAPVGKSLAKEKVVIAPVDPSADAVQVGSTSYKLSTLSSSTRLNTPTSVTVTFNEPVQIAPVTCSAAPPCPTSTTTDPATIDQTQICLDDSSNDCLNAGGTLSLSADKRSVTWTAPANFSLPGDVYHVVVHAVAATCPNENVSNYSGYECEDVTATLPNEFTVDDAPPVVSIAAYPNPINATNITAVPIGGSADGDTREIDLTFKSSGGGSLRFASLSVTPNAGGTGTIAWSTTQNLGSLPDGALTITARGVDESGNVTPIGSEALATTALQARPSAPQNLSVAAGNGQAVLSWLPPATTGGHPITGYSLTTTDTTTNTAGPSASPAATLTNYTLSGLTNGHSYSFALTAANDIGSGQTATTSATPKGNTSLTLSGKSFAVYNSFYALSGRLTYLGAALPGKQVTITSVYYNGTRGPSWRVTTDQFGQWSIAGIRPWKNITYSASYAGDSTYNPSSAARRLYVRVALRIIKVKSKSSSHNVLVTLHGAVGPNQHGRRVYIYEVKRGHYKRIGYAIVNKRSYWNFTHKWSRGTHYVVAKFFGQNGNAFNRSNRVKFARR